MVQAGGGMVRCTTVRRRCIWFYRNTTAAGRRHRGRGGSAAERAMVAAAGRSGVQSCEPLGCGAGQAGEPVAVAIAATKAYIGHVDVRALPRPCVICGKPQAEGLCARSARGAAPTSTSTAGSAGVYAIPSRGGGRRGLPAPPAPHVTATRPDAAATPRRSARTARLRHGLRILDSARPSLYNPPPRRTASHCEPAPR